ncbi:MAG: DUF1580 domain-containing protein [Pirellulaceae bacterium]|nr:DUF1580 domain-containing protein [Pirellulaceae bacterium]
MIDISCEKVVSLTTATKLLPTRRQGKRPDVCTLYRWTSNGVRGIRLESLMVGGTRCTSVEALQRFFDALTAQADGQPVAPPPRSKSRQRQIEAAEKRLAASGI